MSPESEATEWRWKAVDVAVKIAMPILLGVTAWTATSLLDHDKRLNVIEATRYTQRQAAEDRASDRLVSDKERQEITRALSEIKILLARLEEKIKPAAGEPPR